MNKIDHRLYLGDLRDATFRDPEITASLCLMSSSPGFMWPKVYEVPMIDGEGIRVEDIARAVETLEWLLSHGETVLVHCHMGISRSPTVVACYLAKKHKTTFSKALQFVGEKRPIIHPNDHVRRAAKQYLNEFTL